MIVLCLHKKKICLCFFKKSSSLPTGAKTGLGTKQLVKEVSCPRNISGVTAETQYANVRSLDGSLSQKIIDIPFHPYSSPFTKPQFHLKPERNLVYRSRN